MWVQGLLSTSWPPSIEGTGTLLPARILLGEFAEEGASDNQRTSRWGLRCQASSVPFLLERSLHGGWKRKSGVWTDCGSNNTDLESKKIGRPRANKKVNASSKNPTVMVWVLVLWDLHVPSGRNTQLWVFWVYRPFVTENEYCEFGRKEIGCLLSVYLLACSLLLSLYFLEQF